MSKVITEAARALIDVEQSPVTIEVDKSALKKFARAIKAPEQPNPLYHDEELDFHVLAHIYAEGRQSPPHDHGSSWAIYGQAILHTEMVVWDRKDNGAEDGKADLEVAKQFRLDPGMAGVFQPGDVHSIKFPDGARFVRVTGTDLKLVSQKVFNLDEGTVQVHDPMPRAG